MISVAGMPIAGSKDAVRDYVTGADHLHYAWLADGNVQVNVTHSNLKQYVNDLRLDLHSPISEVKRKLYTHNGSSMSHMELQLKDRDGNLLARMLDDDRPLGFYGVQNGMEIHVVDHDPFSLSRDGGLDDVSRIEKYTMSEDDYDKREKSYRAWKRQMVAADPTWRPPHMAQAMAGAAAAPAVDYTAPACVEGIAVGARCSVSPGDRRGEVAYVGPVAGLADGFWVGVRLDEPMGKNDGTHAGKQYFEAGPKYGSFVRPDRLAVGDFPPAWEDELGAEPAGAAKGEDEEL